jgi:hypothetical protein
MTFPEPREYPVRIDDAGQPYFNLPFTAWLMDIEPETLKLEASLSGPGRQDVKNLPTAWIIQGQEKRKRLAERGITDMDDVIAAYMRGE